MRTYEKSSDMLSVKKYFDTKIGEVHFFFRVRYLGEYLSIDEQCYIWTYKAMIYNGCDYDIKVLGREWQIVNGKGIVSKVVNQDILGENPVLSHNEIFEYESATYASTDSAVVYGNYIFLRVDTNQKFLVDIPALSLDTPSSLQVIS